MMQKYYNKVVGALRGRNSRQSGFVLLFAVIMTVVVLSISLGVSNITFQELVFSTSARYTNEAFFAADVGVECALYYDFNTLPAPNPPPPDYVYVFSDTAVNENIDTIYCAGEEIQVSPSGADTWTFTVSNLGEFDEACARVSVARVSGENFSTEIISRGYNFGGTLCDSQNPSLVERVLEVRY